MSKEEDLLAAQWSKETKEPYVGETPAEETALVSTVTPESLAFGITINKGQGTELIKAAQAQTQKKYAHAVINQVTEYMDSYRRNLRMSVEFKRRAETDFARVKAIESEAFLVDDDGRIIFNDASLNM